MITVDSLTYQYVGAGAPAVRGLSFTVEPGEILGFLGPSGAGKSTTQKILIGLLRDYEGRVVLLGQDLGKWGAELYEHIGVSFEVSTHYLKLTGIENLRFLRALYRGNTEDPHSLLAQVGLLADANKRVAEYSKGMRNRLNVARALLHHPRLLFMDEPTAGLDPVNAHRIKELISRRREMGAAVFLTTHNMSVANELCDRVAFIVDGEIKLLGRPRELRRRFGRRAVRVEYGVNGAQQEKEFALDDLGDNVAFLDLLRRERVETIHTQETTLESVFMEVTGKELSEDVD